MKKYAVEWLSDQGQEKGNVIEAGNRKDAQEICDDLGICLLGPITHEQMTNPAN